MSFRSWNLLLRGEPSVSGMVVDDRVVSLHAVSQSSRRTRGRPLSGWDSDAVAAFELDLRDFPSAGGKCAEALAHARAPELAGCTAPESVLNHPRRRVPCRDTLYLFWCQLQEARCAAHSPRRRCADGARKSAYSFGVPKMDERARVQLPHSFSNPRRLFAPRSMPADASRRGSPPPSWRLSSTYAPCQ